MIGGINFKAFYAASLFVAAVAVTVLTVALQSLPVSVGFLAGYAVGIFPFASWHWIVWITDGFRLKNRFRLALFVMFVKYAVIGAALYFLIASEAINLLAFMGGMAIIVAILFIIGFNTTYGNKNVRDRDDE